MLVFWTIFDSSLSTAAPLTSSLVQLPPPLPCANKWISVMNTRKQCVRGDGVLGLGQINTCRKVPLQISCFRWRHFVSLSSKLIGGPCYRPSETYYIRALSMKKGWEAYRTDRARIFKLFRSPRLDSNESIPPAYVGWRAGTTTLFLLGS
jgi:hypothetical protein